VLRGDDEPLGKTAHAQQQHSTASRGNKKPVGRFQRFRSAGGKAGLTASAPDFSVGAAAAGGLRLPSSKSP
jgi:hypothetical protein